jgi:hypothetical protein
MKFSLNEISLMTLEKEIITKTKIQTKNELSFFKTFNHILNVEGISISLNENSDSKQNKLFEKNGFQFVYLYEINEFIILPNEKLDELISDLKYEIDTCCNENELIELLINNTPY